ncbi:MAG TPA: hypothetical protein VGF55_12110 [Gemmataceae bacterium]|jgi:hypothetical protein
MDDLDDLLTPKPPPELPGLRDAVLGDAARVQRRRRWVVRGRRIAVLAACYTAGLMTAWHWPQAQLPPRPTVVEREPPPPPEPANPPPDADPYRNDPPERLERWAFISSGEKRVGLYRRAGDGFLRRDDVAAALRCYRRALDGGTAADLAIRADTDTWLLMSLKVARQKEKPDAHVN